MINTTLINFSAEMLCQRMDRKSEEFGSVCPDQNRFRKCVSDLIQLFCRLSADRLNFLKLSELRNRNGRPMFPGWRSHGEVKTTPPIIIGLTKVNRHASQKNLRKKYFNSSSRNKFFMKLTICQLRA